MIDKETIKQEIQAKLAAMPPEQREEYRKQARDRLVLQAVTLREQARFRGDTQTVKDCTAFLNKAMAEAAADDLTAAMR